MGPSGPKAVLKGQWALQVMGFLSEVWGSIVPQKSVIAAEKVAA